MRLKRSIFGRAARVLFASSCLLLAGCAAVMQTAGPHDPLPPLAPGTARLIVYREANYTDSQSWTVLSLNNVPTATTQNDTVLYRDVAPGVYSISVSPTLPFPNQFKTVTLKPGDVTYVQIGTLAKLADMSPTERSDQDTFIVSIVDPATGAYQVYNLRQIQG
jgi:hypothetical protein